MTQYIWVGKCGSMPVLTTFGRTLYKWSDAAFSVSIRFSEAAQQANVDSYNTTGDGYVKYPAPAILLWLFP